MARYKLIIGYDGTAYAGWQIQPNGMTVQQRIQDALAQLTCEHPKIHGSGRTDAGVHGRRQVAHVDLERKRPCRMLLNGLNALLPADIRLHTVAPAAADFHARRSAIEKEYRYFIWNGPVMPPHKRHYATHVRRPLDIERMNACAALLVGRHDFAAFAATPSRELETTVRDLRALRVSKRGRAIVITARGDGFLYKMVRSLAGYLIRVGVGDQAPTEAVAIRESGVRTARVPTAPPQGLFLWNVWY